MFSTLFLFLSLQLRKYMRIKQKKQTWMLWRQQTNRTNIYQWKKTEYKQINEGDLSYMEK